MPNYVMNKIEARGSNQDIMELLQKCTIKHKGKKHFSLNKIIPMPEDPQPNWYNWSIEHWGTKWDAIDSEIIILSDEKVSISFMTAWECPFTALKEMSKMFPEITFEGGYAEEFIPANCGKLHLKNGILEKEDMEGDVEFACSLWGEDPAEWRD